MSHIAVLGAGSWGTAFGSILANGGNEVRIWGRRPEVVAQLNAGSNDRWLLSYDLFFPGGEHMTLGQAMSVVNTCAPRWHRIAALVLDHDTGHGISQALVDTWHDCFDARYRKRPSDR